MAEAVPPMTPVGSPESTPSSPSSVESSIFSPPGLNSHRDSVSTTSTAFSSVDSSSESGDQKERQQSQPCPSCKRPQLLFQPAQTSPATSTAAGFTTPPSTEAVAGTSTTATTTRLPKPVKHDPLSRHFPKPTCGATIEEMLARDPGRWSLNHWIKNGAKVREPVVDKETAARRFAETKAALLESHKEMTNLTSGTNRGSDSGSGSGLAVGGRTQTN